MSSPPDFPVMNILELKEKKGNYPGVVVEIGFGHGEFLNYLADVKLNFLIVGIEIASKYFKKVMYRMLREGIPNVVLLKEDARTVLYYAFEPNSIDEIYANFPDPWPKSGQKKRRITNEKSLRLIFSRLKKGGTFYLSTDSVILKEELLEFVKERGMEIEKRSGSPFPIKTKYERKWQSSNKEIHYFIIKKRDEYSFGVEKGGVIVTMPHVMMEASGSFLKDFIDKFKPFEKKEKGCHFKSERAFLANTEDEILIPILINEEFINQRIFVSLRRKGEGYILKLYERDKIIVTRCVLKALYSIKDFILRDFEVKIMRGNL